MATATNHTIDEIINEINEDTSGWSGVITKRVEELNKLAAEFMSDPSSRSYAPGGSWVGTDGTTTFTAGNNEPLIYEKVDVNKFDKELYEFIRDELFD